MTPKEKAKELVDKYYYLFSVELENTISYYESKQCALISVDLLLKDCEVESYKYWYEVKQEIEKL